ncbi:MAG TPA: hypothetical protein VHD87_02705 [Acidimicrobiales bacterium]|nr:hypothetical protein [Acidimicrobiales bacterium]
MQTLLSFVPLAACAGMMLVCMSLMRRSGHKPTTPEASHENEVAALRAEVTQLRAELRADPERAADRG